MVEYKGNFDWYHFDIKGLMTKGLYVENASTYCFEYMDPVWFGRLLTGNQIINGQQYVIPENGKIS